MTVALQRYQPEFMDGLRRFMEPLLGPFFRLGAKRAARSWAKEQGVGVESPETAERADAIYRHEVDHLPQALIWTASSIAINLATQKLLGNKGPLWQLAAGKTVGAGISAGLVVGGRGLAPDLARNWDQFTSKTLFLPATKAVGGWFGVHESAVDGMVERQKRLKERDSAERVSTGEDGQTAGLGAGVAPAR